MGIRESDEMVRRFAHVAPAHSALHPQVVANLLNGHERATANEFVALAKAKPGTLLFVSAGKSRSCSTGGHHCSGRLMPANPAGAKNVRTRCSLRTSAHGQFSIAGDNHPRARCDGTRTDETAPEEKSTSQMTRLEQLQKSGMRRVGTPARGFNYKSAGGTKVSAADLKRIDELKIPPAWSDAWINAAAGGAVQAIGRDAAGRLQSLYHANHVRRQEARKFRRLIKFAEALPKMRATVASHIKQPALGREPVMAAMLRILSTCFLRPGSQVYTGENGSFGLATLRPRHVKVKGDVVEFDFTGKSGVQQQHQLTDRRVSRIVRSLLKQPSREVFKYQNADGGFINVTRHHINDYIREVMGENFSAKDFRTWAGTLVCACALARLGTQIVEKSASRKRQVVEAIKETADILGNTPAVCRSSYICPEIINSFENGKMISSYFNTLDELITYRGRKLHAAEKSLLAFMRRSANS